MKNNLAKLSKIFNNQSLSAGFTLIELLVAASITTVVVSLSGASVVSITENNKNAKAETERRVELNRALDFISEEVRQAKVVFTNASATISIVAPGFNSSGKTPILTLQIPGVDQRVIYYIAPKPAGSPWLGPNIVYRWGPKIGNDGRYTNAINVPEPGGGNKNPAGWENAPLVDLVVDSTPSPNLNCPNGWFPTPAVASRQGFYACVDPDGKIAETHLYGKLVDAYGKSKTSSFEVSTKAFARSYEIAAAQAAVALAAAEAAATALAAALSAAASAAVAAATAVSNLGTLQTAADNAATTLTNAISALTAAQNTASTTPTAENYTALAAAERAVATAITNARTTATAAATLQAEVARTAGLNAAAQQAVVTAATAAQTTAASASQSSTEQAATTYTTAAQTTATQAVTNYTTAAQTAAAAATTAQAADERNAATLTTATVAAATTHTNAAIAADQEAAELAIREATNQIFTTANGTVTFTRQATGSFKIIGGDSGGIPTTTTVHANGSTTGTSVNSSTTALVSGPTGTKITVKGKANQVSVDIDPSKKTNIVTYGGFTADSAETNRNTQVWALRNGDTLPPFTPYPGQVPPRDYLRDAGFLDANGKVKLADNQVIYLFEVTTTNKTRSDYDMQDIIVLATIEAVPIAPTIAATVSGTTVTLSWSAVTYATGYELYKGVVANTGSCTPTTFVSEVSSGVTQNVSSITTTQKICFAVKAKNSLGDKSDLSNKLGFNRQGATQTP